MTRVLPRSTTATVTQHSFDGCTNRGRFWRYVGQHRPLPAGSEKGLTSR